MLKRKVSREWDFKYPMSLRTGLLIGAGVAGLTWVGIQRSNVDSGSLRICAAIGTAIALFPLIDKESQGLNLVSVIVGLSLIGAVVRFQADKSTWAFVAILGVVVTFRLVSLLLVSQAAKWLRK